MLIVNGEVHTMADGIIPKGYVWAENGKIRRTGHMSELKERDGKGTVYDVKGAWVMPGLVEAHAHIGITEEKYGVIGDDCNEQTNPITPALRALDAINPMDPAFHDAIAAGITTVMAGPGSANVVGGQFALLKTHGRCVDHMVIQAPAAMKVALGENPKTAYGDQNVCPSTRMGTAALLRRELFQAAQYLRAKEEGRIEDENFDLEPWIPVLKREIPMKVHAHRADDILTALRIAREFHVDITLDHCTEGHLIAEEIAASGFPAIIGPDLTSRSKIEVQNMNFKTNRILHEAGVLSAITTDHPVSVIQSLPLSAGLAVRQGLPVEEGLKSITINAARILRADNRIGSLEAGKDADIAVYTGNPMETLTRTLFTFIDGELIYRCDK